MNLAIEVVSSVLIIVSIFNIMMVRRLAKATTHLRTHLRTHLTPDYNILEAAWVIIANAGGGNWKYETAEWRQAAERWRDTYHSGLAKATTHLRTHLTNDEPPYTVDATRQNTREGTMLNRDTENEIGSHTPVRTLVLGQLVSKDGEPTRVGITMEECSNPEHIRVAWGFYTTAEVLGQRGTVEAINELIPYP